MPLNITSEDEGFTAIENIRWTRPEGEPTALSEFLTYPVTHVSLNDALAYCAWKGMRLPTEIEWEYAARGGLDSTAYPWGDLWQLKRANLWQGQFPYENQLRDGYYRLSPVDAYPPQNNYQLYDMLGNTWEWTLTKYFINKFFKEKRKERSSFFFVLDIVIMIMKMMLLNDIL